MKHGRTNQHVRKILIGCVILCAVTSLANAEINFDLIQTPNGGIQPRAVLDEQGTIHLIYYKPAGRMGNLFYVTRSSTASTWTDPVNVNTEPGNVVPNGSIGVAHMALGKKGRVHVSWFDMHGAKYWYTRSNDDNTAFEPQRNLVKRYNKGIEASGALAADEKGNVYMFWHAGDFSNEANRRIFMTHSTNDGESFSAERRANPDRTGSCACCGLSAIADQKGTVYVSYRAAGDNIHRDMTLLKSTDFGKTFESDKIHKWQLPACPVTITSFAKRPDSGAMVTWETQGRTYVANVNNLSAAIPVGPAPISGRQKNAAVAVNSNRETLVVWGLGKGYSSGGILDWQAFDANGNPTTEKGDSAKELPRASVPAVVALPDNRFLIIY